MFPLPFSSRLATAALEERAGLAHNNLAGGRGEARRAGYGLECTLETPLTRRMRPLTRELVVIGTFWLAGANTCTGTRMVPYCKFAPSPWRVHDDVQFLLAAIVGARARQRASFTLQAN